MPRFCDAEFMSDCRKAIKGYIKNELRIDLKDDDNYHIHSIGLKKVKSGQNYQQFTAKFRSFPSRMEVYQARKCNTKINVRLDLRRLSLCSSAFEKAREH